jgi:hypothetical protein
MNKEKDRLGRSFLYAVAAYDDIFQAVWISGKERQLSAFVHQQLL